MYVLVTIITANGLMQLLICSKFDVLRCASLSWSHVSCLSAVPNYTIFPDMSALLYTTRLLPVR